MNDLKKTEYNAIDELIEAELNRLSISDIGIKLDGFEIKGLKKYNLDVLDIDGNTCLGNLKLEITVGLPK